MCFFSAGALHHVNFYVSPGLQVAQASFGMAHRRISNEIVQLPWVAPRWDGRCPTLIHLQTIMIPREVYPLFHEETYITDFIQAGRNRGRDWLRAEWAESSGQPYPQESAGHMDLGCPWVNLNDLNWNCFLQVIFTRCVLLAETTPSRAVVSSAVEWTAARLEGILFRLGLDDLDRFIARLQNWMVSNDAASSLVTAQHEDRSLSELCRPGAWLLDCVFTEILIILANSPPGLLAHLYTRPPTYMRVGSAELRMLAGRIFHEDEEAVFRRDRNYVCNVMRHLAWLLFEDSREELIVAMAYWLAVRW